MTVRLLRPYGGQAVNTLYTGPDEAVLKATSNADDRVEEASDYSAFQRVRQGAFLNANGLPSALPFSLPSLGVAAPNGRPALPVWSMRRDLAATGTATRPTRIANVGDSKTMGAGAGSGAQFTDGAFVRSRPAQLAALLSTIAPVSLWFSGFVGLANVTARQAYDPRVVLTNVTGNARALSGTFLLQGAGTGVAFTQDRAVDRFSVLTQWDNSRPAFTVSKGAESFTLTPNGGGTVIASRQEVVFTTKDAGTINIGKPSAGSGTPIFGGVAWDSANPGFEVMIAATYGIKAVDTAARQNNTGTDFLPLLELYAPDLTIINLGTNDVSVNANVALSSYLTAVGLIIDSALISGDCIVAWPAVGGISPLNGADDTRAIWKAALQALVASKDAAIGPARGCVFEDQEAQSGGRALVQAMAGTADGTHEAPWLYRKQAVVENHLLRSV